MPNTQDAARAAVRCIDLLDSDCTTAAASGDAVASQRRHGCDNSSKTPYYEDSWVTIYHGDAAEIARTLTGVIVTDPPYGMGNYKATNDDRIVCEVLEPFRRKTVFGYPEVLAGWCRKLGAPDEWITWWPTNKFGGNCGAKLQRTSEAIAIWGPLYCKPKRARTADESCLVHHAKKYGYSLRELADAGDVWRDPSPGIAFNAHQRLHPNEKPLSLMHKLVKLCSEEGETILDVFCGSGTTLLAAKNLGRRAVGVEREERYCEIAAKRLSQEVLNFTPSEPHAADLGGVRSGASRNTTAQESNGGDMPRNPAR